MPTICVSPPRSLPISREYLKRHCRITSSDEDLLLDSWLRVATESIEAATWRQLVTATLEHKGDRFGGRYIRLPNAPLRKVESIRYLDDAGVERTLSPLMYRAVLGGDIEPGYVELAYGQTWPTTYPSMNAVTIRFIGGYATPFTADPASGVLSAAGHPYADGDLVRVSTCDGDLPSPLEQDTDYYARDVVAGVSLCLARSSGGEAIAIEDAGSGRNFLGVIPQSLIQAIALLVRHFDEHREPVLVGTIMQELPHSVAALISPYELSSRL